MKTLKKIKAHFEALGFTTKAIINGDKHPDQTTEFGSRVKHILTMNGNVGDVKLLFANSFKFIRVWVGETPTQYQSNEEEVILRFDRFENEDFYNFNLEIVELLKDFEIERGHTDDLQNFAYIRENKISFEDVLRYVKFHRFLRNYEIATSRTTWARHMEFHENTYTNILKEMNDGYFHQKVGVWVVNKEHPENKKRIDLLKTVGFMD